MTLKECNCYSSSGSRLTCTLSMKVSKKCMLRMTKTNRAKALTVSSAPPHTHTHTLHGRDLYEGKLTCCRGIQHK